jgi:hypothetical protein
MRIGNRGIACLTSVVLTSFGVACATPVGIEQDPRADFSQFQTWDWQPEGLSVAAPEAPLVLAADVVRAIVQTLRDQGFERRKGDADFFVSIDLLLRRRYAIVEVPIAPYLLSSQNASASYWIEGSTKERRAFEDLTLVVGIHRGPGPAVWRGAASRSVEAGVDLPVQRVVDDLLARLPAVSQRGKLDDPHRLPGERLPGEREPLSRIERLAATEGSSAR